MNITIHILPAAQATLLQPFILPAVWEAEEREHFWYFAATDEDTLIGAAVIDPIQNGAKLLSIAVAPVYTRQGIASMLLEETLRTLSLAKIDTLWMTYALPNGEWEALGGLLEANGFAMTDEDYSYLVPLSMLTKHPMLSAAPASEHIVSLSEMTDFHKHLLYYAMQEKMHMDVTILQECDPALSLLYKGEDEMTAAIFLSPLQNGRLDVLWMWLDAEAHNPKALMSLLAAVVQRCSAACPPETMLQLTCLAESSDDILHYFLPDIQPVLSLRTYLATVFTDNINFRFL